MWWKVIGTPLESYYSPLQARKRENGKEKNTSARFVSLFRKTVNFVNASLSKFLYLFHKVLSHKGLMAQLVKNLPAVQETWIRSLGWEDPLDKGNATHSSILAREFHGLYSP